MLCIVHIIKSSFSHIAYGFLEHFQRGSQLSAGCTTSWYRVAAEYVHQWQRLGGDEPIPLGNFFRKTFAAAFRIIVLPESYPGGSRDNFSLVIFHVYDMIILCYFHRKGGIRHKKTIADCSAAFLCRYTCFFCLEAVKHPWFLSGRAKRLRRFGTICILPGRNKAAFFIGNSTAGNIPSGCSGKYRGSGSVRLAPGGFWSTVPDQSGYCWMDLHWRNRYQLPGCTGGR